MRASTFPCSSFSCCVTTLESMHTRRHHTKVLDNFLARLNSTCTHGACVHKAHVCTHAPGLWCTGRFLYEHGACWHVVPQDTYLSQVRRHLPNWETVPHTAHSTDGDPGGYKSVTLHPGQRACDVTAPHLAHSTALDLRWGLQMRIQASGERGAIIGQQRLCIRGCVDQK